MVAVVVGCGVAAVVAVLLDAVAVLSVADAAVGAAGVVVAVDAVAVEGRVIEREEEE